jgi:hypothetical protein
MASMGATLWALSTNPLAAPLVERTGEDFALALERAVARTASTPRIEAALAEAVAAGDAERASMLLSLADDLGREVDRAEAAALLAAAGGWTAGARDCVACMADVASCRSLALLGACAVPFEMSPLGDLNALRRAGAAWWDETEVDELEAGLALLGLGATGAALATGGTSLTVKAGAGTLRMARRMGAVTPALARRMAVPVAWDRVPDWIAGRAPLAEVTDVARLAALGEVAADLGRVRAATSTAEALRLTRLVKGPEEARALARIAVATGPRTSRTVEILGLGRATRAGLRLSRGAVGAMLLIWMTLAQAAALLGAWLGSAAWRTATAPYPAPTRIEPMVTRA